MRRAQELIGAGRLALHSVVARYMFLRRENVGASGYVRSWTDNLLWHHGQHATDTVLWFLGVDQPGQTEVSAVLAPPDPHLGIPLDLSCSCAPRAQPAAGQARLGTVAMSYNSHVSLYDYVLIGRRTPWSSSRGCCAAPGGGTVRPQGGRGRGARQRAPAGPGVLRAIREGRPGDQRRSVLPALEVLQQAQDAYDRRQAQAGTPRAPGRVLGRPRVRGRGHPGQGVKGPTVNGLWGLAVGEGDSRRPGPFCPSPHREAGGGCPGSRPGQTGQPADHPQVHRVGAEEGTMITLAPRCASSLSMFIPRRWRAVGCSLYTSPASANMRATLTSLSPRITRAWRSRSPGPSERGRLAGCPAP